MMYEVELKVELTKEEKQKLEKAFKERGFEFRKQTPQKDYYVEAKKSPYYDQGGKYNLRRYRDEDGELIYTAKIWEMVDEHLARQEEEYEVSREKFDEEIQKYPEAIKIEKARDWYWGKYKGQKISLTIDTVDFDHSPETRYFFEAEIDVDDKDKTKETKDLIRDFIKEVLVKEEVVEAPGMFSMAFEKK
jgi:adenylate cyclase class IV